MNLQQAVAEIIKEKPYKIVVSAPVKGQTQFRRATLVKHKNAWQLERLSETQAFHENFGFAELAAVLEKLLQQEFTQLNAFDENGTTSLRISKKGKLLLNRQKSPGNAVAQEKEHNRTKNSILPEGSIIPPLVDMGVFTADGRVRQGMYDKYRQINRFIELMDDSFKSEVPESLSVIDFGCGKSYLTFILYYYLCEVRHIKVEMIGLDLKEKVVENCNAVAQKYGYTGLRFEVGDIAVYQRAQPVDMVVTLHACDTATDYALANAVAWGAKRIFSVPCCQHELNSQMQPGGFGILTRYGIVQERVAALLTDAVRANLLTACGYKTQLVEFVDTQHTPKNIMIRGQKAAVPKTVRENALQEVEKLCAEFSFSPCLQTLLQEKEIL